MYNPNNSEKVFDFAWKLKNGETAGVEECEEEKDDEDDEDDWFSPFNASENSG